MDKTEDCGSSDRGSIPRGDTNTKYPLTGGYFVDIKYLNS